MLTPEAPRSTSSPASTPVPTPMKPSTPPRVRASHSQSDPVLPPGSKVRITGNNRTKWDLHGRVGVVRTAQTLGGWHEVILSEGGIVRVQRNALAVLQLPPADSSPVLPAHLPHSAPPLVKRRKKKSHANIAKLNIASLKRYRNVYKLNVANDCSNDELLCAVKKHFERIKVNETEVISTFLRHIARRTAAPTH